MAKPRYDKDKNESRHAAVTPEDRENMAKRQNWQLKRVDKISENAILNVDCVFVGNTEFPQDFYDGDHDNDK